MFLLLSLVFTVVSIFASGFRGVIIWCLGTLGILWLAGANFTLLWENRGTPILLISLGIHVASIAIGRWWGLLFFVGSVAGLTLVHLLGLV